MSLVSPISPSGLLLHRIPVAVAPDIFQVINIDDVFDGVNHQTADEREDRASYNNSWKVCVRGLKVWCSPSDEIKEYVLAARYWMKIMSASAMVN